MSAYNGGTRVHEHSVPIEIGLKEEEKATIILTSDLHVGAKKSRWDLWEEYCLKPHAGNPNALFLMNGDMINCIAPGDPRYRLSETHEMFKGTDNTHQTETHFYIDLIAKYGFERRNFLGHVVGNHEDAALKHNNYDPFLDICHRLPTPFLGIDGFLKINFVNHNTRLPLVLYYHHGMGGGSRRKGSGAQLEKYINYTFPYRGVDVYAFAHEHAIADDVVVVQSPNWHQGHVARKEIVYVNSGSYLAEENYARRKMYSPKPIGHIELDIGFIRKKIAKQDFRKLRVRTRKVTWQPFGVENQGHGVPYDTPLPPEYDDGAPR